MHPLLLEGLADAVGFVAGVLVAWAIGRLLGFDPFAPGYGGSAIGGILIAGLGGGVGLQLARRWRASRRNARTYSSVNVIWSRCVSPGQYHSMRVNSGL